MNLEGGIRSCGIGSVMFGKHAPPDMELVRLAFPRRVYTQNHFDYVIEVILQVFEKRDALRGLKLCYEAPSLRHFTARFEFL
jgi:tryptophanase